MNRRTCSVVCACAVVLRVSVAAAQSSEAFDQARDHYQRGVALLAQNQFADAAEAFDRSIALLERPAAVYNLAVALRGAGQHRRAITVLEHYLTLTAERDDDARTLLRDSVGRVVHVGLRIAGTPDEVLVDGQAVAATNGPRDVELDPGEHVFEANRRGFTAARTARRFEPGEHSEVALDASLQALPATLAIDAGNPAAMLFVDGRSVGRAADAVSLPAGRHALEVRAPGATTERRVIDLSPGGRLTLSITLTTPAVQRGIASQWWFWTGLGVVAAGAAVGIGVAAGSHTETPYAGTWTTSAVQAVRGR